MAFALNRNARERIERLTEKALAASWQPDDIDWNREFESPTFLPTEIYASTISQILHGEFLTGALCRRLAAEFAEPALRRFAAVQADEEDRHAAVYARYLKRLGGVRPADPVFRAALADALSWPGGPVPPMLAFHVILEGEALRTLEDFRTSLPCPVFAEINARIAADEARHVAFGRLYLGTAVGKLSERDRRCLAVRLETLWQAAAKGVLGNHSVPGFITQPLRRRWTADGWRRHRADLATIGLFGSGEGAHA